MDYSLYKAFHIIFMVSYFAGLFYLVRLFVYYKDTDEFTSPKKEILRKQYLFMMQRLWNIITLPAFCIMWVFGAILIYKNPILLQMPWFHIKLLLLLVLCYYHYWSWRMILQLKTLNGSSLPFKNVFLRQMNEVATFVLFGVVITVVLKQQLMDEFWKLLVGFIALILVIFSIVKLVNRKKI